METFVDRRRAEQKGDVIFGRSGRLDVRRVDAHDVVNQLHRS